MIPRARFQCVGIFVLKKGVQSGSHKSVPVLGLLSLPLSSGGNVIKICNLLAKTIFSTPNHWVTEHYEDGVSNKTELYHLCCV